MRLSVDGVEIAYSDEGSGVPLLFVHAFPLNRTMWDPQVQFLASYCRVITVDLRGHGESDAPSWFYAMDQLSDDLRALLDHLLIDRAVLCGLSMGGYALLAFYQKYRERVLGLILSDTRAGADSSEARGRRFRMAQAVQREGAVAVAEEMLPKLLSARSLQERPELAKTVYRMILSTPISGIMGDLMGMALRSDATPALSEIQSPTLILVGEEDGLTTPAEARLMADKIAGATLVIVPGAAHLVNLEQPGRFNEAVLQFIQSVK